MDSVPVGRMDSDTPIGRYHRLGNGMYPEECRMHAAEAMFGQLESPGPCQPARTGSHFVQSARTYTMI
jgi:hypothetical protein